jgi:flagellin-specific chaperone FliS
MRNRNLINRRLEQLDHTLINLQRIVNTQEPLSTYKEGIQKAQNIIEDLRSMVEREPNSSREQNSSLK